MENKDPFNLSDVEFDKVMTEIDQIVRQKSDKVPGRELLAMSEFSTRFGVTMFGTHPTTKRLIDWFTRMYGDRLYIKWDFGQSVVLVQGEICKLQSVRFFGNLLVACHPILKDIAFQYETEHGMLKVRNVLDADIQGLTAELAVRLPLSECDEIRTAYGRMFLAFSKLEAALGSRYGLGAAPYIEEAVHDLRVSVESLLTSPPNYGQSKWESLQAVEKVVKSCILEKGGKPKNIHKLAELFADAELLGVPKCDGALISAIQCSPDVRYDSKLVTKAEAVEAHYAALILCGQLASVVRRTNAESAVNSWQWRTSKEFTLDVLTLGYGPPIAPFAAPHQ